MNLSPAQSRYLVTLRPGEAAVAADGMDHPLLVQDARRHGPRGRRRRGLQASPAAVTTVAQRHLRRRVRGQPVHAAATCGRRSARPDHHPGITLWAELSVLAHLTGGRCRSRGPPARPAAGPAVPAAGLRAVARRRCGRRVPDPADPRPGQRTRAGVPRRHGDAGPGDAGNVDVPGAGALAGWCSCRRAPAGDPAQDGRAQTPASRLAGVGGSRRPAIPGSPLTRYAPLACVRHAVRAVASAGQPSSG